MNTSPHFSEADINSGFKVEPDRVETNVIFIHSRLDEYGLSASEFRVYAHLARRDGGSGAWPAVPNIAKICRLHPQTVRKALETLIARRMISRQIRPGQTTMYYLTRASMWQPSKPVADIPTDSDTPHLDSAPSYAKAIKPYPSENNVDKGNPNEGNPLKEIPHTPPAGESVMTKDIIFSDAEKIYAVYPKKAAKPRALRAIHRALVNHSFEFLLERTQLYAQTCNSPMQFIPYPSTWFQEERFNDDPTTWRRTAVANAPPPTIVQPANFGCGVSKL